MFKVIFFLILYLKFSNVLSIPYYQCDDPIYCHGTILHQAQTLKIFRHSKTFVDLKLSNTRDVILQNFDIFMFKHNQKPSKNALKKFLRENFSDGDELEPWIGADYLPNPWWLELIPDPAIRKFTYNLIQVWPKLGKKVKSTVFKQPVLYSIIAVKNGFFVPGGIYKESYYLESYWIIKALLICEMTTTVRGILDNFIAMTRKYGYVPKSTRIYHTNNWQPPILAILVDLYIKYTNDLIWLKENIFYLEHELRHWIHYRITEFMIDDEKYNLLRYTNRNIYPRPDTYWVDLQACNAFSGIEKDACYGNIKASGGFPWYYHKRFIFDKNNGTNATLGYANPKRVIPVDLNVYMCKSFKIMARFFDRFYDFDKYEFYKNYYEHWRNSIQKLLYNQDDGIWYDYDIETKQHRRYCYPTNFSPLWLNIFEDSDKLKLGKKALLYLKNMGMWSLNEKEIPADESVDLMKMWLPFKAMVILALHNSGHPESKQYAEEITKRWVAKSMDCECCQHEMFDDIGLRTREFRRGCGWLISVSLELINQFFRNASYVP